MSHYVVLVLTEENGKSVEELLAPYDEEIEVVPYVSKTKEEVIQEAKELQDRFNKRKEEDVNYEFSDWQQKVLSCKTDDEFYSCMRGEFYDEENFDAEGNLLSTYNPNSKWDWYSYGGRFCNYIAPYLKKEFTESLENISDDDEVAIRLKDISFDEVPEYREGAQRFWEVFVEKQPLKEGEDKRDFFSLYNEDYYVKRYGTKENYCKEQASFCPYAFVTPNGKWYEPGRMGWFGMSMASDDDEKAWFTKSREMLMKLQKEKPDLIVNVIDCHI